MKQKDDRLIFLTFKAKHSLEQYMKRVYSEAGVTVSPQQAAVLFILMKTDSISMSNLSALLELDNSAITGLVDRLEKSGHVERTPDANDRRKHLIRITSKGRDEISSVTVITKKINNLVKEGFTEKEIEIFKKVLNSFFVKFN